MKDALLCAHTVEATGKTLHIRSADPDFIGPALGLYMDNVEAEPVLLDDAVDAAVTQAADPFASIAQRPTVAHFYQQLHDESLEERRRRGNDLVQELALDRYSQPRVRGTQGLLRSRPIL